MDVTSALSLAASCLAQGDYHRTFELAKGVAALKNTLLSYRLIAWNHMGTALLFACSLRRS